MIRPNADTKTPLTMFGSARPRKSAARFAGVARIEPSVCVQRSPPTVSAMPKTALIAQTWIAVPDDEERVRLGGREPAQVREEQDLEERPGQHRRDVLRRRHPVEERAVRDQPADREDAERAHTSESVARSRARFSKTSISQAAITK